MKRRVQEQAARRWVRGVLDGDAGRAGEGPRDSRAGSEPGWPAAWPAAWATLELPPAPAVPVGFAHRVARAWAAERERAATPLLGAGWMRAAAAGALIGGMALGGTLSYGSEVTPIQESPATGSVEEDVWVTTSLSEEYLSALSTAEAALTAADGRDAGDAKATLP